MSVDGVLHIHTLSLFLNIWSNPSGTIYKIVLYILKMWDNSSTTWSNHVQLLSMKYGIPPLWTIRTTTSNPSQHLLYPGGYKNPPTSKIIPFNLLIRSVKTLLISIKRPTNLCIKNLPLRSKFLLYKVTF